MPLADSGSVVVCSLLIVVPIVCGNSVFRWPLFCNAARSVIFSYGIILLRKRVLIALL